MCTILLALSLIIAVPIANAQKKTDQKSHRPLKDSLKKDTAKRKAFGDLKFRSIGPAFTSGRIADVAVNPKKSSEWFVAVASGHLWKTSNAGVSWDCVFENYGAYSTSCIKYDPKNSLVMWLGTGENNHQRALGYGNGVYKSIDGGISWENMGLKESRQIGNILIDPRNSNIVFVACEGSVWGPGGDRGLYKTIDGGKTWKKVLKISENTGVNNIICDPRNPDIMYASSEQRRRHAFTKIGGGPETAIYKSTDGGETWNKLTKGLPTKPMGGIGLAISPENPDIIYAIIESTKDASGLYRSSNCGASWEKMSDHNASGQYFNKLFCDPVQLDKIYSVETVSKVSLDGGKTWKEIGLKNRHVDDHTMWIDSTNTAHYLIGGDGGLYESYDGGANYRFISNLPVAQFYRVQTDNSLPFYYVYGGTQDNSSVGGPSRNISSGGVTSDEWYFTNYGDGFWSQVDPDDPNTVYAESQYGGMVRYNKKTGEMLDIRPEPDKDSLTYKWNWDTPLMISPHNSKRLYVAANKIFRSDDRGDSWKAISGDLTSKTDRNSFKVMDKYWSIDAVQKDVSTSLWGTIIALEESTLKEGLIYAGTDDGVISATDDGGKNWKQVKTFPDVPAYTYVTDIMASRFDENTVYASFDNSLRDDFKPYIYKSTDKGKTWESISSDLPKRGAVFTLQQDHVNPDLLFAGTEFGVYFTMNGGVKWQQLSGGIPDIKVRDIEVQRRENDLVVGTFGRGIYILDDYTLLRTLSQDTVRKAAVIFPVKDALLYIESRNKGALGSTYFEAPNPPYGASFTSYLKNAPKTLKQMRNQKEDTLFKYGKPIPQPTITQLRLEEEEIAPYLTYTITDDAGDVVRRINTKPAAGISRVNWDLRYSSMSLVNASKFSPGVVPAGILAAPGTYKVSLSITVRDTTKILVAPQTFIVKPLDSTSITTVSSKAAVAFFKKGAELYRITDGVYNSATAEKKNMVSVLEALQRSDKEISKELKMTENILAKLDTICFAFDGKVLGASDEETPPSQVTIWQRFGKIAWATNYSSSAPTAEQTKAYNVLLSQVSKIYEQTKLVVETDIPVLYKALDSKEVPATPNRLPEWKK